MVTNMTQQERELVISWIVNEEIRLDNEVKELQSHVRFRKMNVSDSLELAFAQQRLENFQEFALIIIRLLNLNSI